MFLFLCILLLASAVTAVPQVSLPFNAQVPPVARVAQYFSFQLSSSTFEPETESYRCSLTGAPPWLNIDSASRTLWGTPGTADVGSKEFNITAATAGGGSAVMEATLEVVDYLGPQLKASVSDQLRDIGEQPRPGSLLFQASNPFSFAFSRDTFAADGKTLTYYATMTDRTPLPAWLSFSAEEVKFFGVAPPLDTSPQHFDVLLIASDVPGYAGGWAQFTLIISSHELVFEPPKVEVKISKDTPLEYRELRSHLKLNGKTIDDADIANASASIPPWLTFDSNTLGLKGMPPVGTESQNVEVTVYSRFGDAATTTLRLVYVSDLFTAEVGPLVATIGERFSYTFPQSIFTQDNVEVRVNLGSSPRWLTYDSASLTIQGNIPDDVKPGVITGVVTVNAVGSSASDSQTFQIQLREADSSESNPTPLVSTSNSVIPQITDQVLAESSASVSDDVSPPKNSKLLVTIIATVVGLVLLIAAFVATVLFCCCRKRKTRSPPASPRKSEISRPIIRDDACQRQHDQTLDRDLEKGSDEFERTPERPPQIQIDLPIPIPPKSKLRGQVRQSQVSSLGEGDAVILANFNRSSDWGYDASTPTSHTPHDSMKLPTESLRMALVDSQSRSSRVQSARIAGGSPAKERPQSTIYRDPPANAGLPVNRRVTGLGHGRNNTYSSPTRSMNRLSALRARDCNSYSSYSTQSTGLLSTTPSTFPAPPSGRPAPPHFSLPSAEKRKSIRIVPTGGSISDRRPFTTDAKATSATAQQAARPSSARANPTAA
ncbi:polarity establishment/cellular polarization [Coniosporium tulheliwenetii]|uniref:Polarity establishment/cellular polarization n=1 Tax=Coniosporium tulheliwenetii TaxID=3383036 RepID=A0ACC2Z4I5_9PEZI|nr:polarity establishment/cellular polarization [Cladosporium sp. JES 115]